MQDPHFFQNSGYVKLPFAQRNITEDQNHVLIGFKIPIIITLQSTALGRVA